MKKFENFCKALDNLRLVRDTREPYDVMTLTGSIALFEICFEQAWKAMKERLTGHGFPEGQTGSPRQIVKLAYSAGMVRDEKGWLAMLVSRNDAAHSYNEEIALGLMQAIKETYIALFEDLKAELAENWM